MFFKRQTVVEGVISVFSLNLLARGSGYFKTILIAAYIGLTSELDSYYMAIAIMGVMIYTFGDVFDSLGIPNLVKTQEKEGDEGYRRLAGSIFTLAVVMSVSLTVLLILTLPLTVNIAYGFSSEGKTHITNMVFILLPIALVYLPYHAIGSFFRGIRNYQVFSIADIILSLSSLIFIILYHKNAYAVATALSSGYIMGFLYLFIVSRGKFPIYGSLITDEMRGILKNLFALFSLYGVFHLYVIVDRYFASFLPSGNVSGLSYGLGIVFLLVQIFGFGNIFITPLSETRNRIEKIQRATIGILFIAIPLLVFIHFNARELVQALFERGMFDKQATEITADAVSVYALGLPSFFLWPVFYRLYQILEKIQIIAVIAITGVIINVALNYIFVFRFNLGVKGIAAATVASNYFLTVMSLYLFRRYEMSISFVEISKYAIVAIAGSLAAYVASTLTYDLNNVWLDIIKKGIIYVSVVWLYFMVIPIRAEYDFARTVARRK